MLEQSACDFRARRRGFGLGDDTARNVSIEFGKLVAVHSGIGIVAWRGISDGIIGRTQQQRRNCGSKECKHQPKQHRRSKFGPKWWRTDATE
jgi:hypothetical protein